MIYQTICLCCGAETDWDDELGTIPCCVACWDDGIIALPAARLRRKIALTMLADGKNVQQIAAVLQVSKRQVYFYINKTKMAVTR